MYEEKSESQKKMCVCLCVYLLQLAYISCFFETVFLMC